ncbi:hypothetical protein EJ05DRAFT_497033 [Pseudovirgaria hyperparasitica]|uniref:Uncharacterized protein n=1 Tax=Pseudovirgaria hyperparasitica TaxID=470096 RepID=A0A6A6WJ52_9PEZI|nr:uncharacterized protein EJ05DRAFT_497033 [Pseudovirgaria hyperparasitica]KAF2762166.1 hypothetical protein EJ05DRAFT_497033 [Pseudovirgaria hyperparasitica]
MSSTLSPQKTVASPRILSFPTELLELLYPLLTGIHCESNYEQNPDHIHAETRTGGCNHWKIITSPGHRERECPARCKDCIHSHDQHVALTLTRVCRLFYSVFLKFLYSDIRTLMLSKTRYEDCEGSIIVQNDFYERGPFLQYRRAIRSNRALMQYCRSLTVEFRNYASLELLQFDQKPLFANLKSLTLTKIDQNFAEELPVLPVLEELSLFRANFDEAGVVFRKGHTCRKLSIGFDGHGKLPLKPLRGVAPPTPFKAAKGNRPEAFRELHIERVNNWPECRDVAKFVRLSTSLQAFSLRMNCPVGHSTPPSCHWSYSALRTVLLPFRATLRSLCILDFGDALPGDRLDVSDFTSLEELQISFHIRPKQLGQCLPKALRRLVLDLNKLSNTGDAAPRDGEYTAKSRYQRSWGLEQVELDWLTATALEVARLKSVEELSLEFIELRYDTACMVSFHVDAFDLVNQAYLGELADQHPLNRLKAARVAIEAAGLTAIIADQEVPQWFVEAVGRG